MFRSILIWLKMSLRKETIIVVFCIHAFLSFSIVKTFAQDFQVKKVSDNVLVVSNSETGENQVVVQSENGLVVFNSFWSEITALSFKDEISKITNRGDFKYTINMVDRLDMFGGNAAYKETIIIGHDIFLEKYKDKKVEIDAEIKQLIDMWRWKEDVSRQRLKTHEVGSEEALNEQKWMNTCKRRADELESGFSLLLPAVYFNDRLSLNLGNITLNLVWFGEAGNYNGMTVAVIPEEKLAIFSGFILHSHHLAPYPMSAYKKLDVPRWITVLDEILEGEDAVENIICSGNNLWSRERAHSHLEYIKRLWNSVKNAEGEGVSINELQDRLSLDNEFSFVKEMQAYKDGGDDWIRPQHRMHVRLFYLQDKNLASEFIKERGIDSLQASLAEVRKLRDNGSDIYFDEASMNGFGYYLMNLGKIGDAIVVFKFNVELFPGSYNVYDSLGEGYMKNGDTLNAIINYKKSLEINPENQNAKEMLKELEN